MPQGPDAAVKASNGLSMPQSGPNFIISYPAGNCDFFLESTVHWPERPMAPGPRRAVTKW